MTHLLCLGDSITDCGRLFDDPPLGRGYVRILSRKLGEKGQNWHITNCGVDGFTTARLLTNAEPFYLPLQADIITVLIGINDIGIMMNTRRTPAQQAEMMKNTLQQYRKLLLYLSKGCHRLVLMEPFIFPWPQEYQGWIPHVRTLSQGIRSLAKEFHHPYLLLHDSLNEAAKQQGMAALTIDGIHLTHTGHELLAEKLLPLLTN